MTNLSGVTGLLIIMILVFIIVLFIAIAVFKEKPRQTRTLNHGLHELKKLQDSQLNKETIASEKKLERLKVLNVETAPPRAKAKKNSSVPLVLLCDDETPVGKELEDAPPVKKVLYYEDYQDGEYFDSDKVDSNLSWMDTIKSSRESSRSYSPHRDAEGNNSSEASFSSEDNRSGDSSSSYDSTNY